MCYCNDVINANPRDVACYILYTDVEVQKNRVETDT
jgi:hypothetical protein